MRAEQPTPARREPSDSIVSRLERALDQAEQATDSEVLEEATRRLASSARDLAERIAMAAPILRLTPPGAERREAVHRLRRLLESADGH